MFFLNSSSFHKINGDVYLTNTQKKLYFELNSLNNKYGKNRVSGNLEEKIVKLDLKRLNLSSYDEMSSPSRKLSDLFWNSLDWKFINQELLDGVKVLDSGCGTGVYLNKLNKISDTNFISYTGFDLHSRVEWISAYKNFSFPVSFVECDSKNVLDVLSSQNLVISQSAIEHFPEDLKYFRSLKKYVDSVDYPVIQIHLIPGPAALELYGLHGIRQYNYRTASKINSIFNSDFSYIAPLGGSRSFKTHYNWLTTPLIKKGESDLRLEHLSQYSSEVNESIYEDNMSMDAVNPHFYALIIGNNFKRKVSFQDLIK
jgi:SAM-dependent methyltransferase